MSEIKKITAEEIEAAMKDYEPETTTVEWRGLKVVVKKTISFSEAARIVEIVTATCFDPEGEFLPICRDFMWAHEIINAYTNIELPEDAESCVAIMYDADLFDIVISQIDASQYGDMWGALLANIKHKLSTEALALKKSVQEMLDGVSRISEAFKGVSPDDITGVLGAFANGGIDESRIVNAILNKEKDKQE